MEDNTLIKHSEQNTPSYQDNIQLSHKPGYDCLYPVQDDFNCPLPYDSKEHVIEKEEMPSSQAKAEEGGNAFLITFSDGGGLRQIQSKEIDDFMRKDDKELNSCTTDIKDIQSLFNLSQFRANQQSVRASKYLKGNSKEKIIDQICSELNSLYEQEHPKDINNAQTDINRSNEAVEELQFETYLNQSLIEFKQYLIEKRSTLVSKRLGQSQKTPNINELSQMPIMKMENLIQKEMLPTLTKEGYSILPTFERMLTMKRKKINKMKNVTITNQYGMIEWLKKVDIEGLDLDKIVSIQPGNVFLYPGKELPKKREGLNKKARITFFNCSEDHPNPQLRPNVLKAKVKSLGGKFIRSSQGVVVYKVNHF